MSMKDHNDCYGIFAVVPKLAAMTLFLRFTIAVLADAGLAGNRLS